MSRLMNRTHGIRTGRLQAGYFRARERRKSLWDPAHNLFRTHTFAAGQSGINPSIVFPDRTRPVTFAFDMVCDASNIQGSLFHFGSTIFGLSFGCFNATFWAAAGYDFSIDPSQGCDSYIMTVPHAVGSRLRWVIAVSPREGCVNLWMNGQAAGACQCDSGDLGDGDGWGGGTQGYVGGPGNTGGNDRFASPFKWVLANARIVTPLSVYMGQLPEKYRDLGMGSGGGFGGSWSNVFDSNFGG